MFESKVVGTSFTDPKQPKVEDPNRQLPVGQIASDNSTQERSEYHFHRVVITAISM
jgi:hypothetical protein